MKTVLVAAAILAGFFAQTDANAACREGKRVTSIWEPCSNNQNIQGWRRYVCHNGRWYVEASWPKYPHCPMGMNSETQPN